MIDEFDVDMEKVFMDMSVSLRSVKNRFEEKAIENIKKEESDFIRKITDSYENRGMKGASEKEVGEILDAYRNDPTTQNEVMRRIQSYVENSMNWATGRSYRSYSDMGLTDAVSDGLNKQYASHDVFKRLEAERENKAERDEKIAKYFNEVLLDVAKEYGFNVDDEKIFSNEVSTASILLGDSKMYTFKKMLDELLNKGALDEDGLKKELDKVFFDAFYGLEEHDFSKNVAYFVDAEELRAKLAENEKLIDDIKTDIKVDETRTLEANFYERTLARTDVDIFFLADNTGSMGGVIASVIKNAQAILDGLREEIGNDAPDARFNTGKQKVNARFGVGSYQDDPREPGTNSSVTGKNGHDASYWLHQAMTDNGQEVIAALEKWDA